MSPTNIFSQSLTNSRQIDDEDDVARKREAYNKLNGGVVRLIRDSPEMEGGHETIIRKGEVFVHCKKSKKRN